MEKKGDLLVKKIIRLLLVLSVIFLFAGCAKEEEVQVLPEGLLEPNTTAFSESDETYKVVAENEFLTLSYWESAAQFMVSNKKDGSVFKTVTSEPAVNAEKSLFEIYYVDEKNNFARMYSHSDSVARGQYQTELIENGVKVGFTLGEVTQDVFCPPAISKDRFEAILEKIESSFDQIRFKQSYFLPDLEKVSEEKKVSLLKQYPTLEADPLYVLTQENLPSSMQKEISRILEATGYTEEDYEIDMQNAQELKGGKNVVFHVNMYMTLEEDQLQVSIPLDEMIEVNGGKVLSISLLKNFGSPEYGEVGQFILPDGSGSTMKFYNGKENSGAFRVPIYGSDKAIPVEEQIFTPEQAYLPIFTTQYTDRAMIGIVSDGEAFAEIHAWPGSDIAHATAYPVFNVRQMAKAFLQGTQNGTEAFNLLQKKLYDGALTVKYYFFDRNECEVADIASYYASELFGQEKQELEVNKPYIYVEFIGAAYNKEGEFSLGGGQLETFTTVAQARSIVEDLVKEGIGPLAVKLIGFGQKGLDGVPTKAFKLNKDLGTQKELEAFVEWTKANNVALYIDVDPQYAYNPSLLDGFSKSKHTSYLITNEYGESYPYWPNTLQMNKLEKPSYILNPPTVAKSICENNEAIKQYDTVGLSLSGIGNNLNSDFQKKVPIDRENTKKIVEEAIKGIYGNQSMTTNGANAFILPYVDHVMRVPVLKEPFDSVDQAIPFLQMVLNGRVGYSDIPVNLSSNSEDFVRESIDAGAGFTYVLTGEPNKSMRKTTHPEYYSTQYETWKSDILEKNQLLQEQGYKQATFQGLRGGDSNGK
ncbi:MAG: DUF5696 domain-containing protein [Niameybacter sp.]